MRGPNACWQRLTTTAGVRQAAASMTTLMQTLPAVWPPVGLTMALLGAYGVAACYNPWGPPSIQGQH